MYLHDPFLRIQDDQDIALLLFGIAGETVPELYPEALSFRSGCKLKIGILSFPDDFVHLLVVMHRADLIGMGDGRF